MIWLQQEGKARRPKPSSETNQTVRTTLTNTDKQQSRFSLDVDIFTPFRRLPDCENSSQTSLQLQ